MKITKLGHCCLLIEDNGTTILTDPGLYTTAQNEIQNIDFIVVTHEHGDHLHLDSVKAIMTNNPNVKIISNSAVAAILKQKQIDCEIVEDGQQIQAGNILVKGHGTKHAEIFEEFGQVLNTGYFFNNRLFYPGDALYKPNQEVEILAFPTAGSWANVKESVLYVLDIKPKKCFPVHDGNFKSFEFLYRTYDKVITPKGIEFINTEKKNIIEI